MKKIKKASKYVVNTLNMINMLLVGLANVWGWHIDKISATIIVIAGVISAYLITGKLFETKNEGDDNMCKSGLEEIETNGIATGEETEEATEKAEVNE